jgi:hypothetical protein
VVHGLGALIVLLLVVVGCSPPPSGAKLSTDGHDNPYADRQALLVEPAAHLRMPGTNEIQHVGAERRATPEGYAPAFDGAIFGTQASPGEVQQFYDSALRQDGWLPDTYQVYLTSTDRNVQGWCKPDRLFRVAIIEPSRLAHNPNEALAYRTLFHATINGRSQDVACPYR